MKRKITLRAVAGRRQGAELPVGVIDFGRLASVVGEQIQERKSTKPTRLEAAILAWST